MIKDPFGTESMMEAGGLAKNICLGPVEYVF